MKTSKCFTYLHNITGGNIFKNKNFVYISFSLHFIKNSRSRAANFGTHEYFKTFKNFIAPPYFSLKQVSRLKFHI